MGLTKSFFPQTIKVDNDIAYTEGFQAAGNNEYRQLLELVPTTASAKIETFYGDKNRLRRFRAERKPQNFFEYKNIITLDEWEMTETIKRSDLEDDQSGGIFRNRVSAFGNAVSSSQEAEFWEFLHNGTSLTAFDGANFFASNRTYRDTTGATRGTAWSNLHLGGSQVDATTVQLEQEHYANIRNDQGKPWGGRMTHIAVRRGSLNAKAARELNNSQFTVEASTVRGTMTTNVFQGQFAIMEFDYGFGASEWLSFDLSDARFKPVKVLSHSVSPGFDNMAFDQQLDDSHDGFWRGDFAYGVRGRWDLNPGYPQTARLHGSSSYTFTPTDSSSQRVLMPNSF